jgi:hypothetical protein
MCIATASYEHNKTAVITTEKTASEVYWSAFLAADPEAQVRFPALPDFLRSNESGTGTTQPHEYN